MEIVKYSQMSIEELKEMLEKERARRRWLEAKYNLLRECPGLEETPPSPKGIIVPFTMK